MFAIGSEDLEKTPQGSSSSQPGAVIPSQKTFLLIGEKNNQYFVLLEHMAFKHTHSATVSGPDPSANF